MMNGLITVRHWGSEVVKEVTLQEAQQILENIYTDPTGGVVANGKTGEIISQIGPNIDEIVVIQHMLGGS